MTRLLTLAVLFASTLALAQGKMAGQARLESQRLCLRRSYLREEKRTLETHGLDLSLTIQFINRGSTPVTLQYDPEIRDWGVADSIDVARGWKKRDFICVARPLQNADWFFVPHAMTPCRERVTSQRQCSRGRATTTVVPPSGGQLTVMCPR